MRDDVSKRQEVSAYHAHPSFRPQSELHLLQNDDVVLTYSMMLTANDSLWKNSLPQKQGPQVVGGNSPVERAKVVERMAWPVTVRDGVASCVMFGVSTNFV